MTKLYSECRPTSCTIGALSTSAKAKAAPVTFDGKILTCALATPTTPLTSPFQLGSFEAGATRVNLCLQVPQELANWARGIEGLAKEAVQRESCRLLARHLSAEAVELAFTSCVKTGASETLRVKVNLEGTERPCLVWAPDGTQRAMPDDIRNTNLTPDIEVKGLWINGGRFGLIFECINLLVDKAPVKSP